MMESAPMEMPDNLRVSGFTIALNRLSQLRLPDAVTRTRAGSNR